MLIDVFASSSPDDFSLSSVFFLLPAVPFALRNSLFLVAYSSLWARFVLLSEVPLCFTGSGNFQDVSLSLGECSGLGQSSLPHLLPYGLCSAYSYCWKGNLHALINPMTQSLAMASSRQAGRLWALPDGMLPDLHGKGTARGSVDKGTCHHNWWTGFGPWDMVEGDIHALLPISINKM